MLTWHAKPFDQLTAAELYAIIALRERVFVVEQRCVYLDADGYDPHARHLWATDGAEISAYLRVIPAGVKYAEASIGRVIVAGSARGAGLGRELMQRGLTLASTGGAAVRIGAQAHLEKFYASLGFATISAPYDEDGIPHIDMVHAGASSKAPH